MSEMFDVTNMAHDKEEPLAQVAPLPPSADPRQRLTHLQDRFIDSWGELATIWGTQRSGGRLHSLLYITPEPLCAEDIGERLQISHGNTSTTVRQLVSAGVIRRMHRPGERRAYFSSEPDPWQWMKNTIRMRREREVAPVLRMMKELLSEVEMLERDIPEELAPELKATRDKVASFLGFLEQLLILLDTFIAEPKRANGQDTV
jgi:DNA-binding transcriptional regulator GbsR (MarR family)